MRFLSCVLLLIAGQGLAYDTVRPLDPIALGDVGEGAAIAAAETRVYVVDGKRDRLIVYDREGRRLRAVGGKGEGAEGLRDPEGIAIAPDGRVYLADQGNARIQILDAEGAFVGSFGSRGSDLGRLNSPRGVAVGADGRVYVADTGNDRVQVFTADGILLYGISGTGEEKGGFDEPVRVAVDPADNVYILDAGKDRLHVFDPATKFIRSVEIDGDDLAVDAYGFVYVLDRERSKVAEVSPDGSVAGRFGSSGKGLVQFRGARGLALAPEGTLLVLDSGNGRIQPMEVINRLRQDPLPPNPAAKVLAAWVRTSPFFVEALASQGSDAWAYDGKAGQFARVGPDGKEKSRFGTRQGKGPAVTKGTRGFAVSPKHGIYVSDTPGNRIQRFSIDGAWKATFAEKEGLFDSRKQEGRVKDPRGIAVNEQGTVYVADSGNRRIDAFSPEGGFLFAFGPTLGAFELEEPHALAWDPEGFLYVLDRSLRRVFKCGPSGALIASWGGEGRGAGLFDKPTAMAFDGRHLLYVLDEARRSVAVFDRDGGWITDLLSGGEGERELDRPSALAVLGTRLVVGDGGQDKAVGLPGAAVHGFPGTLGIGGDRGKGTVRRRRRAPRPAGLLPRGGSLGVGGGGRSGPAGRGLRSGGSEPLARRDLDGRDRQHLLGQL